MAQVNRQGKVDQLITAFDGYHAHLNAAASSAKVRQSAFSEACNNGDQVAQIALRLALAEVAAAE
jgi:hypothetical protein